MLFLPTKSYLDLANTLDGPLLSTSKPLKHMMMMSVRGRQEEEQPERTNTSQRPRALEQVLYVLLQADEKLQSSEDQ